MHKRLFCLLAVLLFLAGCSAKDGASVGKCSCETPYEQISAAMTALYTAPDDFHKENYQDYLAADGPESEGKAIAARLNHNKKRFHESDFADGALESISRYFAENDIYLEPYLLAQEASIRCDSVVLSVLSCIAVPGQEGFIAEVILTDKDGLERTYMVVGEARFDDGKFEWIEIINDGGLGERLGPSVTPAP